jgi:uncharacterized protein (TIGR00251 family)
MANLTIQEINNGVVFIAKIVPGSSPPTRISDIFDGMLKIKVTAPPEKGKANQCLIKFLAEYLEVKKNVISIISGQTNPVKHIQILGISKDTLLNKINIK